MLLHHHHRRRKGAIWPLLVAILVLMLAGLALAVDSALLWQARQELQVAADASALGAALELADDTLLLNGTSLDPVVSRARRMAEVIAYQHHVLGSPLKLVNETEPADVVSGFLVPGQSGLQPIDGPYLNAFEVTARRTRERGTPVGLFFTRMFKLDSANVSASAVALLDRQVIGFRPAGLTVPLVPIALFSDPSGIDEHAWEAQVDKPLTQGGGYDDFAFDKAARRWVHTSEGGSGDGLPEFLLKLPLTEKLEGVNGSLLQIGSVETFLRQVETGLVASDLEDRQGQLVLDENGQVLLDELPTPTSTMMEQLIKRLRVFASTGEARLFPLYTTENDGTVIVTGFVAARVVQVEQTEDHVQVILQPTILTTGTALTNAGASDNRYVGKIKLVR
jgi:hypothetical protein